MKKLKLLNPVNTHSLWILVLYFVFVFKTNLQAQTRTCVVDNYLTPTKIQTIPNISLIRPSRFKTNFKEICQFKYIVQGEKQPILMRKYKLNKELDFNWGIEKIGKDSILYFNTNLTKKLNSYIVKKRCLIEIIGYNKYKNVVEIYFKLTSTSCVMLFSINIYKSFTVLEQFDYM